MKQHMQTLINLLTKGDVKALHQHYLASNDAENFAQLAFMFQQSQKNAEGFEFYQQLATTFIQSKGLPAAMISKIISSDALSFFTPALQLDQNFNQTSDQQRNVLHYLFAGIPLLSLLAQSAQQAAQKPVKSAQPPFNYLRSMMLFESNETLHHALCQRDGQHLTPLERYLATNQHLSVLPDHEFTALLGLIEIQSKQQNLDKDNFLPVIRAVKKLCLSQSQTIDSDLQRLVLIATYYKKSIQQVLDQMQ
jgi:hypothetical protein